LHPEPDSFNPDRFLEPVPEYSLLPFGGGAHRCLGAGLAMLELKVALGAILRRFDLRPTTPEVPPPVRRGILLSPKGGGRIRLARVPAATAPPAAPYHALTAPGTWASARDRARL